MNCDHSYGWSCASKYQIVMYWNFKMYVSCNMDLWINSNQMQHLVE